jgi:plastocyanin
MSSSRVVFLAVLASLAWPLAVSAEIHEVTVGNNFFEPSDLTIQVGDTVRWTNQSGRVHDVTADDFSWASQTSASFTYSRVFNSVEEVLYHCTVHSSPGRAVGLAQNGRINVVEADQSTFKINSALSDAWFYLPTAGQGFKIIVWEETGLVFLSWFTYDAERPADDVPSIIGEAGHRWLTAQGPFEGDTAMLDVYLSQGGVFDQEEPAVPDPTLVGTIDIVWSGCNEALLIYDLTEWNLSGEIPLERIVLDNVPACEAAQLEQEAE